MKTKYAMKVTITAIGIRMKNVVIRAAERGPQGQFRFGVDMPVEGVKKMLRLMEAGVAYLPITIITEDPEIAFTATLVPDGDFDFRYREGVFPAIATADGHIPAKRLWDDLAEDSQLTKEA